MIQSITLIGAGNVATHLGLHLHRSGFTIQQVYSKTINRAEVLSTQLNADSTNILANITPNADLYIIAVKDDAIIPVAKGLPQLQNKLVVHTSGAVAGAVLSPFFDNYGVFYPLQSFSIGKAVDFSSVPLCIHSPKQEAPLHKLANQLVSKVYSVNDEQRASLHVAAVFMNNFSNFMVGIAEDLCTKENVPFEILSPLLKQTFEKLSTNSAKTVQTGPASRGDTATIEKHLQLLNKHPEYLELYQAISKQIPQWLKKTN